MLTTEYISQLRAALWGAEVSWPSELTEDLLRLHTCQGTGPLVYPAVLADESLSSYARVHMKSACMRTLQQHTRLHFTLAQAWKALKEEGLHAVLMKGAGLAALYPASQNREWGDIDLFVGKDQYHPSCAVMRKTFPNALKFDEELDHYKHYNLIADGISIEIHRVSVDLQHPLDSLRYEAIEREGMTHAVPVTINGLELRVPEPTFNALFVLLHAWEHMMTKGANMRQICDHTLLMHHYASTIDIPRLKRYLHELHLTEVWQLFMAVEVHFLGLPEHEAPFYDPLAIPRAERLVDDLLGGRLRTPESAPNTATNRFARKWNTMRERIANARRMSIYSPAYARHLVVTIWLHGLSRLFAKDRHWE